MKNLKTKIVGVIKNILGYLAHLKKYIVYVVLIAFAYLIGVYISDNISSKKSNKLIERIEKERTERAYKDSIAMLIYKHKIDSIDNLYKNIENANNKYKKDISKLKKEYSKLKEETGRIDYHSNLDSCILTVEMQHIVIEKADSIILSQDSLIKNKDIQILIGINKYNVELSEKERVRAMYNNANTNIDLLKNRLEKENTWWRRNSKWVFLGAGLATGIIITK